MTRPQTTQDNQVEPATFTDWVRARTYFMVDPIVTFLARYRLSPDVLTVLGLLVHFLFAWLVGIGEMRWAAAAMFFLTPLDSLDGALARKLGYKQHGFGAFLDSTLDRLSEIILFGGFIYFYVSQQDTLMLAVAYIAITGSLMVSYARARAEGLGYHNKGGLMGRVERYMLMVAFLTFNRPDVVLIILAILTYLTLAQRMYSVLRQSAES